MPSSAERHGPKCGERRLILLLSNETLQALSPSSVPSSDGRSAASVSLAMCTSCGVRPSARPMLSRIWFQVTLWSLVMWTHSPSASGLPHRSAKPRAKSSFHVTVHSESPSPCTSTGLPSKMRCKVCHGPFSPCSGSGGRPGPYVWLGRTIVTGKPWVRQACKNRSSHAILSRLYCQYGFFSGVLSVMRKQFNGF